LHSPFVNGILWWYLSNRLCFLCIFATCFCHFHNISNFFITIISVIVICDQWSLMLLLALVLSARIHNHVRQQTLWVLYAFWLTHKQAVFPLLSLPSPLHLKWFNLVGRHIEGRDGQNVSQSCEYKENILEGNWKCYSTKHINDERVKQLFADMRKFSKCETIKLVRQSS
jgi:hypothetical protein